ncbi:adenylate cyclase [Thermococcus sp. P6]|uniref:class IV adenylate cyclase n=1 Tax=Thermococcus sp. P6 TaxID=122420 RepID=UPI000B5A1318|nr:class IV adenylate cyclase [Thermococcus sp. P6]ASJ10917.1 adenylate cyclase [Thermococcus sp. P6]
MIEVELKGYADEGIFERVRKSFECIRREYHEDTYFNHPCRDFGKTDEALRIRIKRFDGHLEAFLTYKGPRMEETSKTRKELEVQINDPEEHARVLKSLGFTEVLTVRKTRERYYVDRGITIALDEVNGLGKFVEIEYLTGKEDEVKKIVGELREILKSLGVKRFERRSYLELMLEKGVSNGHT